jgi:hypothetical protein
MIEITNVEMLPPRLLQKPSYLEVPEGTVENVLRIFSVRNLTQTLLWERFWSGTGRRFDSQAEFDAYRRTIKHQIKLDGFKIEV